VEPIQGFSGQKAVFAMAFIHAPETARTDKVVKREHGIDERISIDNLVFGTSVLFETVKRFMR